MASGKSLIGKELARILNFEFIDLDYFIEAKEILSINEIFKTKGEIYFRKKEHEYLQTVISNTENKIISLGGGTPCYSNNMELILNTPNTKTVYLQVAIPNLAIRLLNEPNKRPLIAHLNSEAELIEFIGKHLFERFPFYKQSQYTINANTTTKEIIESIVMQLF